MFLSPPSFLLQWGYAEPISFLASRIPLLDHSINQCEIGSFQKSSESTKQPSHRNGYAEKWFWKWASQGFDNGEEKSRGIWRVSLVKIVNESILFSLGFLSQNSLLRHSLNRGYKVIYIVGWEGMWKVIFWKTGSSGGFGTSHHIKKNNQIVGSHVLPT